MTTLIGVGATVYSNPVMAGGIVVQDTGWLNFTISPSFSSVAPGDVAWTDPGSALDSDAARASYVSGAGSPNTSEFLKGIDLAGTPVPGGSTPVGIETRVQILAIGSVQDQAIRLVKGGTLQGDNKADTVTDWVAVEDYIVYGGSDQLWGLTLTAADVNAADFGFAVRAQASSAGQIGFINHMQMKIYYTA